MEMRQRAPQAEGGDEGAVRKGGKVADVPLHDAAHTCLHLRRLLDELLSIVHWEKSQNIITMQFIPRIIQLLGYLPFTNLFEKTTDRRTLTTE